MADIIACLRRGVFNNPAILRTNMKHARMTVLMLALTMLLQVFGNGWIDVEEIENTPEFLEEELPVMEATSPGHVVFGQYVTSTNCGYCMQYGSPAHRLLKTDYPDDYVYVSLHSADYGNTDDAESGNIAPIYAVSHLKETGGAPKSSFGDAEGGVASSTTYFRIGCGSNTCWDAPFSSGGGMHSTVNDYRMVVTQADNGDGTSDVTVSSKYTGSGTPPSSLKLYATVTDMDCKAHPYTNGFYGGNCWEAWLLDGGSYSSNAGTVGGGSGFETVNLNGNQWSNFTWTVPNNLVHSGASNMNTVAALYSGWSTSSANEDVYHATDSTMGPLIDVKVNDLTITNDGGWDGYVNGDTLTLQGTIENGGDEMYSNGGDAAFYRVTGVGQESQIGSSFSLNNLAPAATQTFSIQVDTTGFNVDDYDATFRLRLSNLVNDKIATNNYFSSKVMHDFAPTSNNPTIIGSNQIQRYDSALIEVKAQSNDGVDNMSTMTPSLEFSSAGQDAWTTNGVTGGVALLGVSSGNERYEFSITPDVTLEAGDYDIRLMFTDARGQDSPWVPKSNAFSIMNSKPVITADPVPTVKVETATAVSMIGHISDAETDLSNLVVSSTSPNFISWDANSQEMTVQFNQIQYDAGGNPIQSGIYVTASDGVDETGGTLLFNVIENGMPRWAPVPSMDIQEGGGDGIILSVYLSDTDENGIPTSTSDLQLAVINNSNPSLISANLNGMTLNVETVDEDAFGTAVITLRASDGIQYSDTTLTVHVQNINDAPNLDLATLQDISLMKGEQKIIDLGALITDSDDDVEDVFVRAVANPATAARYSLMDGTLTLLWGEAGTKDVTITLTDSHDATNTYNLQVEVISHIPLTVSRDDANMNLVATMSNDLIGRMPSVDLQLGSDTTIVNLETEWQICSSATGLCYEVVAKTHPNIDSATGWSFQFNFDRLSENNGLVYGDQLKLVGVEALNSSGVEMKFDHTMYWNVTEFPALIDMSSEEIDSYVEMLQEKVDELAADIALLPESSTTRTAMEADLASSQANLDSACAMPDVDCSAEVDGSSSSSAFASDINYVAIIGIVLGVIIVGLLVALTMRGKDSEDIVLVDYSKVVPAMDAEANSMYGGAADIFQQPVIPAVSTPAPPVMAPPPMPGVPPLPETGLPDGWSMEQWQYYGHQYLLEHNLL